MNARGEVEVTVGEVCLKNHLDRRIAGVVIERNNVQSPQTRFRKANWKEVDDFQASSCVMYFIGSDLGF